MVGRRGDLDPVVAELERELAASEKLLVLPAGVIRVGRHAREPLRDLVDVVLVLLEIFEPAARADFARVDDVVPPAQLERRRAAGLERLRQVDAHHGADDRVVEILPSRILHVPDFETALEIIDVEDPLHVLKRRAALEARRRAHRVSIGVLREAILVELQPEVVERVQRAIVST